LQWENQADALKRRVDWLNAKMLTSQPGFTAVGIPASLLALPRGMVSTTCASRGCPRAARQEPEREDVAADWKL